MLRNFLLLLSLSNVFCEKCDLRKLNSGDLYNYPSDYCESAQDGEYWDYIVVGAGTAGSIVGRRLAELDNTRVLILEAGEDPPPDSDFPSKIDELPSRYHWNYESVPSKNQCLGQEDKKCIYKNGKALGGSSSINYPIYTRGNPEDENEWEALGNKGWSYKDCKPYFEKTENYAWDIYYESKVNKSLKPSGPLTVSHFQVDPPTYNFKQSLLRSTKSLGYKDQTRDAFTSKPGFLDILGFVNEIGYRQNTAKIYLHDIPDNLRVCKNALVDRIIFANKTAKAVEYFYKGKQQYLIANREIILSAGALNSPLILERSGIGNEAILKKASVNLIHDLMGVGENLQDRFVNKGVAYQVQLPLLPAPNTNAFGISSFGGFISIANDSNSIPDVQILPTLHGPTDDDYTVPISVQYQLASFNTNVLFFSPILLREQAKGNVHIKSNDPKSSPIINLRHFSNQSDINKMLKAMRKAMEIIENKELAQYKPKFIQLDQCRKYKSMSDAQLTCLTKYASTTIGEVAGTCKMGPESDPTAVVDNSLRVHGVRNLRVIDASIMPLIPRGNLFSPTAMVAEKAADIVKKDYYHIVSSQLGEF